MISIPSAIQQNFQQAVDDVLNNITGRNQGCILYYPPIQTPCPNFTQNGNLSSDYWVTGDPQWIHSQQGCPLCNGQNFITTEQSVTITMAIYWKPSQFNKDFPADNRHAEGVIQTKGFASDLTKVLNCSRMQAFSELGTDHYQFKLLGEPICPGKVVPNRYFYSLWQRV
jgi:hypothetical protein